MIALLLGPSGTGLISAFQSSTSLLQTLAGLGINNSAVRDIAQANSKDNQGKLSIVVKSLRKLVLFTGLAGLILTIIFAQPLSEFTFETIDYTWEIRLLSIAVFFNLIQAGQSALIQGMRRIKDLARMSILSSVMGTVLSLPLIYFFEFDGISVYLVALAIGQFLVSLYYARKIKILDVKVSWRRAFEESKGMIKLGSSFMGASLATVLGAYLVRVIIIRDLSLTDAGIYQAAYAISGIYAGVIFQAMGKDFYPRLAGIAFESKKEIQLINEQTQVGMVLAAPGLMFTLALAPIGIRLLYSVEYIEAYPVLQWMILGVFLRTIAFPMGYLFIARAKGKTFLWTEIVTWSLQVGFVFFGLKFFGLKGTGIAFFVLYILYTTMMFYLLKRENNFRWTKQVMKTIVILSLLFGLAFTILQFLNQLWGSIIVCAIGIILTYIAYLEIIKILEMKSLKELIIKLKKS
ncbi:O-antigen translocase [Psychroflexus planctonicus]|uniref:O-antigen translocase n=1 Tax=Psychroflexus planctonicus TaxID=1526575 RepID=A0ABQ1SMH4_9FLAO|nr:O-antigen translocase [Psychroflexus planctonicus]